MNVAVDLRIVGTQSLQVYDTVTVQKQITGKEVGADVYRFFGDELFDFNVGSKDQEPLQLAVRMAIEAATLDLISSVSKVPATDCLSKLVN
jgi:curli production assembly/transport component CsgG/holdfast attachment protein HfaB